MALFFRVIEREDGWACHQGRLELDRHHGLDNALRHLRDLATEWDSEAQLFVHRLDGTVTRVESGDS